MKEVFHFVCAPSLKNKCRYNFGEQDNENYKNYKECSKNIANRLKKLGLEGKVCFFSKSFSKKEYCIKVKKKKYRPFKCH